MSKPVCRVGDTVTGTCTAHFIIVEEEPVPTTVEFIGTWGNGSDITFNEGLPVIRVGDTGTTDCGHNIVAVTGSTILSEVGIPIHRVDDEVEVVEGGSGVSATGSSTWKSD